MPKLKTGKTLCTCYSKVYTRQDKLGTCGEFVHEFVRAVGGRGKGIPQIMTYTVNNLSPLQAHYFKGSLHKLRLHFLAFDHVPTPPSLQFLCSKFSIFLTTYHTGRHPLGKIREENRNIQNYQTSIKYEIQSLM